MRKTILAIAAIFLLTICAFGQTDSSKFDFFAGYSYLHVGDAGDEANIPAGFELQGTGYFNKNGRAESFRIRKGSSRAE